MALHKAGQVTGDYGISSRMLRYYEQVGLIESRRVDDYAYRMYDENARSRLRQIIVLRKLRIPIKQIAQIFGSADATQVVEEFVQKINEIEHQIAALETVRTC